MYEIKVRNYRGCASVDMKLENLTLLAGHNDAGKTSTLDAIRCASVADSNPFVKEIPKKYASMLVRSGTPSGFVEIKNGKKSARIDWPQCEYKATGGPAEISPIAAGLKSLAEEKTKDRINYITTMMKAEPTNVDLVTELIRSGILDGEVSSDDTVSKNDIKVGLESEFFTRLWEMIDINGWDITLKSAQEKGAKFKGRWEHITGANYGKRVAAQWYPEAWSSDLDKETVGNLEEAVKEATEWRDAAIRSEAIDEAEVEKLKIAAANIETLKSTLSVLTKSQEATEKEKYKLVEQRRKIESKTNSVVMECPSCHDKLIIKNNNLIKSGDNKGDKAKIEKELKKIDDNIAALNAQNNSILTQFGERRQELKEAEKAAATLSNSNDPATDTNIADVESTLELATNRLNAFKQYHEAREVADTIIDNMKLQAILKPDGLRNKKLLKEYNFLNNNMLALTDAVGWKPVEINADGDILAGGVPYGRLNAKSVQYRTRVLLQIMVALAEKSAYMIIDDADELTEDVRNELFAIVVISKKPAIVVTALNNRKKFDKLPATNGNNYYWIKEGKIEP